MAVGDASLVPTKALQAIVADADPVMRQRARHWLLQYALAPHAKWETDGREEPELTVAELEQLLTGLAESGDRAAVLALLAAKDPARYGPPERAAAAITDDAVDTVDFSPRVVGRTDVG